MRVLLILIGCLMPCLSLQAQIAQGQRDFRAGYLDSLRNLEDFQYGEEPIPESGTVVSPLPEEPAPREPVGDGPTLILLLIIFAVIAFIAVVVLRQFSGKNKQIQHLTSPTIQEEEAFRTTGFQNLIEQAEGEKNWRTAFRFRYLALLRQLEEKGVLDWHPHKTDETYLDEIQDPAVRNQFFPISTAYSWIWYGQVEVSEAQYQQLLSFFHPFSNSSRT